ncbi:MAG: hypothetical protein HY941_02390, partial [Gammaproteobacteria bacterium]|nr:hypothetical protein [Gammaproteobacteria bacterium]
MTKVNVTCAQVAYSVPMFRAGEGIKSMGGGTELQFSVTAHMLDAFCDRVRKQARKPGDAVHALTAVQSFLSQTAPAALNAPNAQPLRECLNQHLDAARAELIGQQAEAIRVALRAGRIESIAACYTQLSRSGFRQAAELGAAQAEAAERLQALAWLEDWIEQARVRARGAYPDTF